MLFGVIGVVCWRRFVARASRTCESSWLLHVRDARATETDIRPFLFFVIFVIFEIFAFFAPPLSHLRLEPPIQQPILHRLGDVGFADLLSPF